MDEHKKRKKKRKESKRKGEEEGGFKKKRHRSDHERQLRHKKDKKNDDKKKKRKKDKKKKPIGGNACKKWGKYGIVREADFYSKQPEFRIYVEEVKKLAIDSLPSYEQKKIFQDFCEDYNTCTMPSKKFYDLEYYERKKYSKSLRKKRIKEGKKESDYIAPVIASGRSNNENEKEKSYLPVVGIYGDKQDYEEMKEDLKHQDLERYKWKVGLR